MSEPELETLLNLGPRSISMLRAAGISTLAELEELGAVEAYLTLKREKISVSLNMLYVIHGALNNVHWNQLDREERTNLIMELDDRMEEEGL